MMLFSYWKFWLKNWHFSTNSCNGCIVPLMLNVLRSWLSRLYFVSSFSQIVTYIHSILLVCIGKWNTKMSCPICQKPLDDQEKVVLREKWAAGIKTWAEKKAHSLRVIAGTLVHTECRRKYTKPEKRDNPPKTNSAKRLTGLSTGGFDFRLNLFLCARFITGR